jgi:hypothetical protein
MSRRRTRRDRRGRTSARYSTGVDVGERAAAEDGVRDGGALSADLHHLAAELLLVLNGDATEEFERSVTIRRSLVKDGLVSPGWESTHAKRRPR